MMNIYELKYEEGGLRLTDARIISRKSVNLDLESKF